MHNELLFNAEAWGKAARPCNPECGARLVSTVYWIGGKGYSAFLVWEDHAEQCAVATAW